MISLTPGKGFLILAGAFIAFFAPGALLRFAAYLLLLFLVAAFAYSFLASRGVVVEREGKITRSPRMKGFPLRLTLTNRLPFALSSLVVSDGFGRLQVDRFHQLVSLPAGGTRTIETTARGLDRGAYELGPVRLRGADPFGLFPWERLYLLEGTAVVYPSILPIELRNDRGLPGGSIEAFDPIYEDVTRFRSVRGYVVGDEPKRVNWKASAKIGRLLTTEYDRSLAFPVRVLLNLSRADYPERHRDSYIERAVETAAAVVFEYTRLGMTIGLVLPDGEGFRFFPERGGWAHADNLFEALARAQAHAGECDYGAMARAAGGGLQTPSGLRVILIGPQPSEGQRAQIGAIQGHGRAVELLKLMPDEESDSPQPSSVLRVVRIRLFGENLRAG